MSMTTNVSMGDIAPGPGMDHSEPGRGKSVLTARSDEDRPPASEVVVEVRRDRKTGNTADRLDRIEETKRGRGGVAKV